MKQLRLNEHYVAPQGEGPRTGRMTQFVRFAGCNMRCPGWPCDTQHAIQPKLYLHDGKTKLMPAGDILQQCEAMRRETGADNICLTGGEPTIQPEGEFRALVDMLSMSGFFVEMFSNMSARIIDARTHSLLKINMDWKLTGSGEADTGREIRLANYSLLYQSDTVKFVVKDYHDLGEAHRTYETLWSLNPKPEFWVGAAWGHIEDAAIVDFVKQNRLPWRLNVQMHKHIYPPDMRGV